MKAEDEKLYSVLTVVGKDRIGIVYEVAKVLAEEQINIVNISQQLMDDYFTMILLLDTTRCPRERRELVALLQERGKAAALDLRLQDEALFAAMHRI